MASVSTEEFFKLPKGAQLLVVYALINDIWEMQLLKTDRDCAALLRLGWLSEKKSPVAGTGYYEFPGEVWASLTQIADAILSSVTEDELERYKARKNQAYPWTW